MNGLFKKKKSLRPINPAHAGLENYRCIVHLHMEQESYYSSKATIHLIFFPLDDSSPSPHSPSGSHLGNLFIIALCVLKSLPEWELGLFVLFSLLLTHFVLLQGELSKGWAWSCVVSNERAAIEHRGRGKQSNGSNTEQISLVQIQTADDCLEDDT